MKRRWVPVVLAIIASWSASAQIAPTYTVATFAGGGLPLNIAGTSASLYNPPSVAVDSKGNVFFINVASPFIGAGVSAGEASAVLRLDAKTGVLTSAEADCALIEREMGA